MMRVLITVALAASIFLPIKTEAQIITDRPTVAPNAMMAVQKGSVQMEATAISRQGYGWTIMQTVFKYGIFNRLSINAVLPGIVIANEQLSITPITGFYAKAGIIQKSEGMAVSFVPFIGYNLMSKSIVWSVTAPIRIVGTNRTYAALSPYYAPGLIGSDLTTSFNWTGGLSSFHEVSLRASSDLKSVATLLNVGITLALSNTFQLDGGTFITLTPNIGALTPFLGFNLLFN